MKPDSLDNLRDTLRDFVAARDWEQFHTPKNLAMAIGVEAGELMEHFQWVDPRESLDDCVANTAMLADEIADVLILVIRLADKLDIDPIEAAHQKIQKNATKYPVERARGSRRKYTEI